jgi:hypothetical protein
MLDERGELPNAPAHVVDGLGRPGPEAFHLAADLVTIVRALHEGRRR